MQIINLALLLALAACTSTVTHNCIYYDNTPNCSDLALSQHYIDGDGNASSGADNQQ
jgi:hypothetical protein